VTAKAVEAACWMAERKWDYPEHLEVGLEPHAVREKYYYARGPQLVNRVVDVSSTVDTIVRANMANVTQGPASGNPGATLRRKFAERGLKLEFLGEGDDASADYNYIKHFILRRSRELGKQYGFQYAEKYHYIGPRNSYVNRFVEENAVPL